MKSQWKRSGWMLAIVFCVAAATAGAQQYTMTLLGFAPFSNTITGTNGLNNRGDIVGYDSVTNGAFFWSSGLLSDLGMPSGVGVAINSTGWIAVRSWGPDLHSYLYNPNRVPRFASHFTDLGTLGGSGGLNNSGETLALAMNDSQTIVGASTVGSTTNPIHAFSWSAGHMSDLGVLPGGFSTSANAINNAGQIVGDSYGTTESTAPSRWSTEP